MQTHSHSQTFDCFMDDALYHPDYGYYTRVLPPMTTDYFTAVEFSSDVAQALAVHYQYLNASHPKIELVEFGGGTGRLARDLLEILADETINYQLIEKTPISILWQKKILYDYRKQIHWSQTPNQSITPPFAMIIMHEVLDAFPAKRGRKWNNKLQECYCRSDNNGSYISYWDNPSVELETYVKQLPKTVVSTLDECNEFECRPKLPEHLLAMLKPFKKAIVFIVDYGDHQQRYYHPQRGLGTLRTYPQQDLSSPISKGKFDITVDVDFSQTAQALASQNFEIELFLEQGNWLMEMTGDKTKDHMKRNYLVSPNGMGERFKVLVAARDITTQHLSRLGKYDMSFKL